MYHLPPFPTLALTLALSLACTSTAVLAEKADKNKPMNAEADALRYDDLKQTSVFTGNVVITKGSIIIRGARVDVRQDPEGFQLGMATAAPGKLAFFRQKREGVDEWMEGESEVIDYDGRADIVKFSGKAVLRRYKGSVLNDETTGSQIVYDNTTDVFNVVGGAANATSSNPSGRIRAMLTPKETVPAGPAAAASSAASAATPSLRPSTSLGGERK